MKDKHHRLALQSEGELSNMAVSPFGMLLVIATILLPTIAMGAKFTVGDEDGWKVGFDYQAWAADKTFLVGDTLLFNYHVGEHNVFKVNGTQFQSCAVAPESEALSSGSDSIMLATSGKKWYICGFAGHCNAGQKLVINVLDNAGAWPPTLPPSPAPPSLGRRGLAALFPSWMPTKLLPGLFN